MKYLLTFIVGAVICYFASSYFQPDPEVIIDTQIDTLWLRDTVIKKTYYPKYQYITNTDTIRVIDTIKVIEQYYSKFAFLDTLINNDTLFIALNDTVSQNRIKRAYTMNLNIPTIYEKETIKIYPNSLYIGAFVLDKKIGLSAAYSFKKNMITIGIDQNTNLMIGYSYRIR